MMLWPYEETFPFQRCIREEVKRYDFHVCLNILRMGWQDGSVGRGVCCQTTPPELYTQVLHVGRRERTLTSCPLTSTGTPSHM